MFRLTLKTSQNSKHKFITMKMPKRLLVAVRRIHTLRWHSISDLTSAFLRFYFPHSRLLLASCTLNLQKRSQILPQGVLGPHLYVAGSFSTFKSAQMSPLSEQPPGTTLRRQLLPDCISQPTLLFQHVLFQVTHHYRRSSCSFSI